MFMNKNNNNSPTNNNNQNGNVVDIITLNILNQK